MLIEFSTTFDGAPWAPGTSLGATRIGPTGLMGLLQNRLGLSRKSTSEPLRVAQYLRVLREVVADREDKDGLGWAIDSLEVDPWGTAKEILALRDEAIASGWDPGKGGDWGAQPRLTTLLAVEKHLKKQGGFAPGFADDLAEVVRALEAPTFDAGERVSGEPANATDSATWPLGISKIQLLSPVDSQPALWPRVFRALRSNWRVSVCAPGDFSFPEVKEVDLEVVKCLNDFEASTLAAEAVRVWGPSSVGQILATSSTEVLDAALNARNLPRVGVSAANPVQPRSELLPLVLKLVLREDATEYPVDVLETYTLLTAKLGPLSNASLFTGHVRYKLTQALGDRPSVEGSRFQEALSEMEVHPDADVRGDAASIAELLTLARGTAEQSSEERAGAAAEWLKDQIERRTRESKAKSRGLHPQTTAATLEQIRCFLEVLNALDRGLLGTKGITDLATECATTLTAAKAAEAAPWVTLSAPQQVFATEDKTTIWWGAVDEGRAARSPWSSEEVQVLQELGAHLLSDTDASLRETSEGMWRLSEVKHLVVLFPERRAGERVAEHPLLQQLVDSRGTDPVDAARFEELLREHDSDAFVSDASLSSSWTKQPLADPPGWLMDAPLDAQQHDLAARSLKHWDPVDMKVQLPDEGSMNPPVQVIPRYIAAELLPRRLSPTQSELFLTCTLCWMLQRKFELTGEGLPDFGPSKLLIGNVVHAAVEQILIEQEAADGKTRRDLSARVKEALENQFRERASIYLTRENKSKKEEVVRLASEALVQLFEQAAKDGIVFQGAEVPVEAQLALPEADRNLAFTGYIDLLGTKVDTHTGKETPVIVDMKWTNSKSRYPNTLKEGRALQLAAYSWAHTEGSALPGASYFLLKQGSFVPEGWGLGEEEKNLTTQTWESAKRAIDLRVRLLSEGIVTAIPGQLAHQEKTLREYVKRVDASSVPVLNPITEHSCQYSATKIFCGGHP